MLGSMSARVLIKLEGLGEEATKFSGCVNGKELIELDHGDVQCAGGIEYELRVRLYGEKELVVEAQLNVPLKLRCERCLREFDYSLPVHAVISLEISPDLLEIDLAKDLREEILLALPAYPKCELAGLECENHDISGDFGLDKAPLPGVNSAAASERSVWDALDAISTTPAP